MFLVKQVPKRALHDKPLKATSKENFISAIATNLSANLYICVYRHAP